MAVKTKAGYSIVIINDSNHTRIPRAKITQAVTRTLQGESIAIADISVILLDDTTIHEMNRKFLQHDYPTDVITFPLEDNPLEGEIYISVDTAAQQAKDYTVSLTQELMRLAVHGTLHLIGYDDGTEQQRARMSELETLYIES
jgi:probable rRNA maturation factor